MATYTAAAAQSTAQPRSLRVGLTEVSTVFSFGVAPATGDVVQMIKVTNGMRPIAIRFMCNNATPSWMFEVGDGINTARYHSCATHSANVGWVLAQTNILVPPVPYTYSADDTIDVLYSTVTASNATISGAIYMTAIFSMNG
jgi:hypothetical protein